MRNLGHGQSVVFCASPEVDRDIRRLLADEGHCYAWHKRVLIIYVQCLANLIYFVLSVTSSD